MLSKETLQDLSELVKGNVNYSQNFQEKVKSELIEDSKADTGTERIFYALTKWDGSLMHRANLQFLLTRYFSLENKSEFDWIERNSENLDDFAELVKQCFELDFDDIEKQRFNEFLDWIKDVPGTVAEAFNRSKNLKIWVRGSGKEWELFIIGKRELIEKIK